MNEVEKRQATDEELLEQLRRVGTDLGFRIQIRKYLKWIVAFLLFVVVVSFISGYAFYRVIRFQRDMCESSNEFRKAYVDQWEPIIADNPLPDPPPEDALPEIREAYERQKRSTDRFIEGLETDFAPQEC